MKNFLLILLCGSVIISCTNNGNKVLSEEEQRVQDSVSKVNQRATVDSMKKKNPLLILPPDSTYTGDYIDKYPNGIIKYRGQFRFGQRHGQWLSFYPNGRAWSELHFDKGARHGLNVAYHENGKVFYKGYYKNDQQDSLWNIYDSIGQLTAKVIYKNGRIIRELPVGD